MSNKIIFASLILLVFSSFSSPAFGEDPASSTTSTTKYILEQQKLQREKLLREEAALREKTKANLASREAELTDRLASKQAELQGRIASKQAEIKLRLTEKRKELISEFFNRMVRRIEMALGRQSKIAERIATRLAKMKANGKNVSLLETKLVSAKAAMEEAKSTLGTAKGQLPGILSSDDPKTMFAQVRELVKGVVSKVKEIHQMLVEIITEMRGMSPETKTGESSSSSEINISTSSGNVSVKVKSSTSTNVKTVITITP